MLKITAQALLLVSLRATLHHAFVPQQHALQRTSPTTTTTRAFFSTTLSQSDRDVVSFGYDDAYDDDFDAYADSMEEITKQILSDYDQNAEWNTILTTNIVLSVLTYHSNSETVEGAETVDKILDRLEARSDDSNNENDLYYKLHCGHYTIAVTAWSRSGHPDSAEKATQIVHRMKARNIEPNEVTYNTWMNAYVIQNNVQKVEEILQIMEEKIPNEIRVKDYNVLILANARKGRAKEAEQIVKNMVDDYSLGKSYILPDLISYSMLLEAWSKSTEEGRGARAESILDSIEERQLSFDTSAYANPESTISGIYVAAMRAVIHSGEEKIIDRVEHIYQRIIDRNLIPDAYVYATLLDAYAIQRPSDAAKKVPEILKMTHDNLPDISFEDQIVVYNTALKVLKESRDPDAAAQAEELFQTMKSREMVDEVTYGTMIALYTNDNGGNKESSAKRAQELLKEMNDGGDLEANTHHMNSAMNSWIRAGDLDKAADLLDQMEEAYKQGNRSMRPNVVSYSTLMNGWVKAQKSEKAKAVFDRMTSMFESGNKAAEPNFISYVTLIDCIVKSGEAGSAESAESIVRNMYKTYQLGESNVKPNAQLVATVIDCWSKSGDSDAGERAETLLNWLFEIYKEDNDPKLIPSAYPFTSTIAAWAKSRKFGKAARAQAILNKMKSLFESGVISSPPNTYCYTAVINACAYTERDAIEKRDALQVFVKTYKEMIGTEDVLPNHVTFATVLTALRNLLPADEKRAAAVKTVFEKCTESGMCDQLVARRLQSILNTAQLRELVGNERVNDSGFINVAELPTEWTCNVPSRKETNKRR